jgi:hypothetical protein
MVHMYYPESVLLRETIGKRIIDAGRHGDTVYITLDDGSEIHIDLYNKTIELEKVSK